MIVVDTGVWVDHFRRHENWLAALIEQDDVCVHPFVLGELLLGGLPGDGAVLALLNELAKPPTASAAEAAAFIGWARLAGSGVGYVDTHLLLSAKLAPQGKLLTRDKRLHAAAERLGIAYQA